MQVMFADIARMQSGFSKEAMPRELPELTRSMIRMQEAAWVEFHARYYDRMLGYAITLHRGNAPAAEDTVQNALLRVVRHIRTFSREGVLWSWLTLCLRCAAADQGRQWSRQNRLHESLLAHLQTRTKRQSDSEILVLLDEALGALAEPDRLLLTEKYMHGQRTNQLAQQFDLTPKAVENRLRRLRKSLKSTLHELTRQTR